MKDIKKSVCIIRSNPVRPDSRVEKEAWALKKAGYDVHILAWDRDTDIRETESSISVAETEIPITRLGYKATFGEGFKNIKAEDAEVEAKLAELAEKMKKTADELKKTMTPNQRDVIVNNIVSDKIVKLLKEKNNIQ